MDGRDPRILKSIPTSENLILLCLQNTAMDPAGRMTVSVKLCQALLGGSWVVLRGVLSSKV